jgi:hypothetical protein
MRRILQAATFSVVVTFFAAACANRALARDPLLAVLFGVAAGFFLAFVIGYVIMYFEERPARVRREAP